MYYNEIISEIQSQKEREVRADRVDSSSIELQALERTKSRAKALVWADYSNSVALYLKP